MPCIRRAVARVCTPVVLAAAVACAGDGGVGTEGHSGSTLTVRISPKTDSLGVGESRRFAVQVVDQAGVPRPATVAWMSINNTIATVNASGDVTALAPGLVGIVATIGSSADTASLFVLAGQLVVEPNAIITAVGEEIRLSATTRSGVAASGAPISWRSSDENVATVSTDGTVTAVGPGDATLTAISGEQTGSALVSVKAKDVGSLRITPATSSLYPKATEQLQFTAYDDAGRTMSVLPSSARWTSSSTTVLAVTDEGFVTAKGKGSAIITARIGNKSASATVNVLDEPVASVAVTLDASSLEVGQITQARATLKDASDNTLTNRSVAWQSSNPAIATVNSSGVVTAVARGSATISAISDGKVGGAGLTVAPKTVAAVVVAPNPASATVGQTAQLTATPKDAAGVAMTGRTITWTSSNPAVATVSATGLVTAVSSGSSTISATADGITGQSAFTATAITATSVAVTPSSPSVQIGQDLQLSATAYDASGSALTSRVPVWSSSNPTIATVSNTGRVTGVAKGSANVTASVDGKTASALVAVNDPPPAGVASISVVLHNPTVNVGQTTWASAELRDASGQLLTGRTVSWSSAVPTIATVSTNGTVTTVGAGSVSIVATSEGVSGAGTLVVNGTTAQPVATVSLSATSTSMYVGQSQAITVTLRDALGNTLSGRTIGWSSSNLSALTVSPLGQVQAVGVGTSTVTATSEGKTGTLTFTVTSAPVAPVASVTVSGGSSSLNVGQSTQLSATAKDAQGTVLTGRTVTWTSSAPGIASVSSSGSVTAIAGGTAVINATIGGVVGSMPMTIINPTGSIATVSVSLGASAVSVGQGTQATATARDASGNTVPTGTVSWSSSNTSIATVSSSGAVSAIGAGQANITATAGGKSGSASITVNTTTGTGVTAAMPELPRAVPTSTVSGAPSRVVRVAAGQDLQAVLSAAQPGDEIRLASGARWVGNYRLPTRSCTSVSSWITVRTDIADSQLPAAGVRITPAFSGVLAKIETNNNDAVIRTTGITCGWRFLGIEMIGSSPVTMVNYGIVQMGDGGWIAGGDQQDTMAEVPQDIIFDRVYLHGTDGTNTTRCLAANTGRTAVVNSYLTNCHARGFDAQAIETWNGPGPFLIENNFLAGSGENVMFGGADPGIPNMSPSDITIRRNHFWKDPAWKGQWTVKNLFELKHAKRVLVEGNVFENNWADAQAGMAIVIKSLSDGETAPWTQSADVTIRYNIIRNSPRGFNVQGKDGIVAQQVARVRLEHNLFENIGQYNGTSSGWLNLITHMPEDIALVHNTMVNNTTSGLWLVMDYGNGGAKRLVFEDNVFTNPSGYALFYSGAPVGSPALNAMAGSTWSFARNVAAGVASDLVNAHPAQSWYPSSTAGVGFVSSTDYRLASTSAYKGRGAGGTDPGADIDEIMRRTTGATSGSPSITTALVRR